MTPEQEKLLKDTALKLDTLLDLYYRTNLIDKTIFPRQVYFEDRVFMPNTTISAGGSPGLKIGNASTEKLGFFGETPVAQQGAISAPSGGATIDSQARAAVSSVITALQNLGLTA